MLFWRTAFYFILPIYRVLWSAWNQPLIKTCLFCFGCISIFGALWQSWNRLINVDKAAEWKLRFIYLCPCTWSSLVNVTTAADLLRCLVIFVPVRSQRLLLSPGVSVWELRLPNAKDLRISRSVLNPLCENPHATSPSQTKCFKILFFPVIFKIRPHLMVASCIPSAILTHALCLPTSLKHCCPLVSSRPRNRHLHNLRIRSQAQRCGRPVPVPSEKAMAKFEWLSQRDIRWLISCSV